MNINQFIIIFRTPVSLIFKYVRRDYILWPLHSMEIIQECHSLFSLAQIYTVLTRNYTPFDYKPPLTISYVHCLSELAGLVFVCSLNLLSIDSLI